MNKKYEITDIKHPRIRKCFRIKALRDFSDVKAGDLGGYVEGEHNLSHKGKCWIYDDAAVIEKALVKHDARVSGSARVSAEAWLGNRVRVSDFARVHGKSILAHEVHVLDFANVHGHVFLAYNARVFGDARVNGNVRLFGDARVFGSAVVSGDSFLTGKADVGCSRDHITFPGVGSENRTLTVFKDRLAGLIFKRGCFTGTLSEFADAVEKNHGDSQFGREYRAIIEVVKIRFGSVT